MRYSSLLYEISVITTITQFKKIIFPFTLFLIVIFSSSTYGQLSVKSLLVNIETQDVSFAGHIIYNGELTDDELIEFVIADSSLSVADLKFGNTNDTIYLITELLNYIQFGKAENNTSIISEDAIHKFPESEVESISLLTCYQFFPVRLIIIKGNPVDESLNNPEEAEMVYPGNYNNYEYIIYSRSEEPISDDYKRILMSKMQNTGFNDKQLADELMKKKIVVTKYFYQ